jgi:hypothetical protein
MFFAGPLLSLYELVALSRGEGLPGRETPGLAAHEECGRDTGFQRIESARRGARSARRGERPEPCRAR